LRQRAALAQHDSADIARHLGFRRDPKVRLSDVKVLFERMRDFMEGK